MRHFNVPVIPAIDPHHSRGVFHIGLYTVRLTVMAVRLTVEYGMAKPLTIHQAIFWDCLCLWDSCIMAEDSEKW